MNCKLIILSTLAIFVTSCAQIEHRELEHAKVVMFDVEPSKDLGLIQTSLKEQVAEAIKVGGRAPEYLASDLFIKANDASIRGDFHTAVQLFRYVKELQPNDDFVQKKLSVELIRAGELKEAESILSKVYSTNKKDESIGLILAGVYTALEKNSEANEIYKSLITHGSSDEACLYYAKSLAANKKYNEAHKILANCEKKNNDEPSFAFYRGKIEYERGHIEESKKFFERALKIDKTYFQASLAIGAIYEDKENFKKAIAEYKKFLAVDGNNFNIAVLTKMVNLMVSSDEYSAEVVDHLENLVSLEPNDLNLKVRLGLLYSESNKYDKAIKTFKEVLEVVPESDKILYYLGALHQQVNKTEEASDYYKKITNVSPLFGDASVQLGQIYSARAREDFAAGLKEKVVEFHSFINQRIKEHEEIGLELKMVEAGFYDDTFQFKNAISALTPYIGSKNFTESHNYYYASLLEKDGQFLEARGMIAKMLEKDPNNPHALNFLGYSFLERKENMDKAFEYISKAVKLKPDDGYIRDSLAWYFYSTGKYQEALKEAKKAFELVRSDVIISKHLAIIYESLKNYDKAKEFYAEALKNAKVPSERDDVLKLINNMEKTRLPASVP